MLDNVIVVIVLVVTVCVIAIIAVVVSGVVLAVPLASLSFCCCWLLLLWCRTHGLLNMSMHVRSLVVHAWTKVVKYSKNDSNNGSNNSKQES